MKEDADFQMLKELLLDQEWNSLQKTEEEVKGLQHVLEDYDELENRLAPHFSKHIESLQDNFPKLFGKSLSKALERQIVESRKEIIEALYPIIGQLITRYLKAELDSILARIDQAQDDLFSVNYWKLRIKSWITGTPYRDWVVKDNLEASLEEVFLIEKDSGLLLGHYSATNLLDPDMIAGMLTGIKGFVEHAFNTGEQQLEELDYNRSKILVHNAPNHYFAVVLDGAVGTDFKMKLDQHILEFLKNNTIKPYKEVTSTLQEEISSQLKEQFYGFK